MKQLITKNDDVMTIKDFKESCKDGLFIDYDGFCYLVCEDDENYMDTAKAYYPSNRNLIPKTTKKIVWFNR